MIRILHVFHEMANGGIEHFVMDYYRHIDRSRVQFDFLVSVDKKGYFDEEIQSLGGVIHHACPLNKGVIKNYQDIARIVRENQYMIIHRHTGSAFGYFDLKAAKHGGAQHLIMHSHNNQAGNTILHYMSKIFLKVECEKLACSQEAGEWLFGKKSNFKVINNAIECDKFHFSALEREKVKRELGLQGKFVIGHVGRFEKQKNHQRILDIFKQIASSKKNSVLVCIGIGSLMDECKSQAFNLDIQDRVMFLGARSDVNKLMQAFDVFLLPSLYEGFPFVLVEAQASGLPCVVSTCVPSECNVTGNVQFISLEETNRTWAEKIIELDNVEIDRDAYATMISEKGFDINRESEKLCAYYEGL